MNNIAISLGPCTPFFMKLQSIDMKAAAVICSCLSNRDSCAGLRTHPIHCGGFLFFGPSNKIRKGCLSHWHSKTYKCARMYNFTYAFTVSRHCHFVKLTDIRWNWEYCLGMDGIRPSCHACIQILWASCSTLFVYDGIGMALFFGGSCALKSEVWLKLVH